MSRSRPCAALLSAILILIAARPACAQQTSADTRTEKQSRGKRIVSFVAGGAAGLVVHEAGHVATGLALGAHPGFKRLDYGVIPFFAVTHDQVSRRHEYLISQAGFLTQHAANEWLLSRRPPLRGRPGAFEKGWLTFNLATSAVYSVAAFGKFGPPERDTRGMAVSTGKRGIGEPVIGALVLAPAMLDGVRYLKNDPAWARWTSRTLKAGLLLLAVR